MSPAATDERRAAASSGSSDELTNVAVAPICGGSLSTWSFISAISGERTSVGEGRSIAASWYVSDLPAPVGMTASVSTPVERGADDRLLSGPEAVEAEELPERGAEIGHPNECTGRRRSESVPTSCRALLAR